MAHHLPRQPSVSDPLAILRRSVTRDQNKGENIPREVKRIKLEHAFRNPRIALGSTKNSEVARHIEEPIPQVSKLTNLPSASTGSDAKEDDAKAHIPPQQSVPLSPGDIPDHQIQVVLEKQNKKSLMEISKERNKKFDTASEARPTDMSEVTNVEVNLGRAIIRPRRRRRRLSGDGTSKSSQADGALWELKRSNVYDILGLRELDTPFRPSDAEHLFRVLRFDHVAYTISDDRTGGETEERRRRLEVLQSKSLDLQRPRGSKKVELKSVLDGSDPASDTPGPDQSNLVKVKPQPPDFHIPDTRGRAPNSDLDFSKLEDVDRLENFDFDSFLNTSAEELFEFEDA